MEMKMNIIKPTFLVFCVFMLQAVPFSLPALIAAESTKPNIIVIYADDMGYGDCTANNPESKTSTPNIDRLANAGMRFTDAHSPASTCTASRYGLLTGTNPARTGVVNGLTSLGPVIDKNEVTVADLLKDQGYVTWMVGKWHLGFEMHGDGPRKTFDFSKPLVGGPLDCGFDTFFGLTKAPGGPPYFVIRGRKPVARPTENTPGTRREVKTAGKDSRTAYAGGAIAPGFIPEQCNAQFCDDVIRSIKQHAKTDTGRPFFLYYAMLQPHTPWLPTKEYVGKSKAGPYGDYIVQLDHEVGRVLDALKASGLEKNTLVIFSSDNGAMWRAPDIEKYGHRANGIFSGTKGTPYEGGHRVPFIVRWPGQVPASTTTPALINHSDLFATLADHLGVDTARTYPGIGLDSHSFLPVLKDPKAKHERPGMVVTPGSYRKGDWKLRFARRATSSTGRTVSNAVLHDLSKDPVEESDVSSAHVQTKAQLFTEYRAFVEARKLKPLAIQVAERRNAKTKPGKRNTQTPKPAKDSGKRQDTHSSQSQKAKTDALKKEYSRRRATLQAQIEDLLTNEQKQARDVARKNALAEGKRGVKLRAATDEALMLTPAQEKEFKDLREAIRRLAREQRQKIEAVLSEPDRPSSASGTNGARR
jgi:arylsulfatase A-like enzyme